MNLALWTILTGCLVAIPCALLGTYLVLRKTVMIGDAISHAVLPGIVIAYLITGSYDSTTMLIGASVMGFVTTFLVEFFNKKGNLQADASIGVTFTGLFALGVILVSVNAGGVDLDQDCVLYGEILTTALGDHYAGIPTPIWFLGAVTLLVIAFIVLGYKELMITTFDPAHAAALGFAVVFWHYSLMGVVSFVTVASFESVGAILVVAFLVAPAATAYLLTDNLRKMLLLAVTIGILSSISGYYVGMWLNSSISAAMATMSGVFFTMALLLSPKSGILFNKPKKTTRRQIIET